MTDTIAEKDQAHRPRLAHVIRRFAPVIILGWLAITVVLTVFVPPLEVVEATHSVSLTPTDARSRVAAVGVDDVLDMHRFLERFDGGIVELLAELEGGAGE